MVDVDLLERIEFVLESKGWSAREWAKRAGLSEPSHVVTIMRRLRADPEADVSGRILAKLADAAEVSMDWLTLGRGPASGTFVKVDRDPRYPARGIAIAGARIFGWSPDAVARVQAVDSFPDDPGLDYWIALLKAEHERSSRQPPATAKKRIPTRKSR